MADQLDGKKPGLAEGIERFNELPKNAKIGVVGLLGFFLLVFIMRSGGGDAPQPPQKNLAQPPAQSQVFAATGQNTDEDEEGFNPVGPDRASLRRGFVTQQTQALQQMRSEIQEQASQQKQEFTQRTQEMQQLQVQLQETMKVLSEQMQLMEQSNARQRDEITRLVEEARRQGLRSVTNQQQDERVRRRTPSRITETRLGGGGGPGVGNDQALLQGVLKTTTGKTAGIDGDDDILADPDPLPFIPPLGFVKATMLNGVDALATSGLATPALARLHGVYKTAMNSTVFLDGCFMLLEFEGNISTERANGRPSRMTCVYPDRGAVTYDVAGYVVDAEDGLEGVPGVFYEGDSGRIALAIASQFAAGIANIIASNQQTNVTDSDGTNQQFLTGSETRGAIAGGVAAATNRLTDYLLERAERVAPFIRIDALRKVHVVLLSGTELRAEGSAWSLLFNAEDDLF